jgi:RNA methyltransferase, TrmH family
LRRALRITSRRHPIVQRCRRLAARRRDDPGVLLDGGHLITEALGSGVPIEVLLTTDGGASELATRAQAAGATVYLCPPAVLEVASPVHTSSGVVAIASWEPAAAPALFARTPPLVLGLVDVQDPGNAGSSIRSADALGATGVAMLDGTADPAGWRALRGAMGSTFHLPIARASSAEILQHARRAGVAVAATVASGGQPADAVDLRAPWLVLLGNEGAGLTKDIVGQADMRLSVPMRPGVESLNIAVTAALVLYEARRQRHGASERR